MLNADRYFSPIPAVRDIARRLYERVASLPLVCPHGHVDPRMLAENAPFPDPAALLVIPDHYVTRMLYSQGIALERLGVPSLDGTPVETGPARDLAALRRSFLSVPRHAERRLAEARARRRVRRAPSRSTARPRRPSTITSNGSCGAGVPAARAVRAVQHRSAVHDGCGDRSADVASADSRFGMGRGESGRRSGRTWRSTSCTRRGARRSTRLGKLSGSP